MFQKLWNLKFYIEDKIFRVKMAYQRAFRGYDDLSVWNYDSRLVDDARIRLEHLLKIIGGCPMDIYKKCGENDIDSSSMWKSYIDDMIYFLKYAGMDGMSDWCKDNKIPNMRYPGEGLYKKYPNAKTDLQILIKEDKRIARGRKYFFKYFYSLWD